MSAYVLSADGSTVIGTGMSGRWELLGDDDSRVVAYNAKIASNAIKDQIAAIEASVTGRRLREAVLGVDGGWLKGVNDQIVALRAQL